MKTLYSIQAARGLAALAVTAFHLTFLLGDPRYGGQATFAQFTSRGNLGVDFFFVLSGFIILAAHQGDVGQPQKLANYFRRRFIRLFPTYWIYTAAFCALLMLGFGTASTLPSSLRDWFSTIFLIRTGTFEVPLTPAWTLMHEWAFYVIFGVLILNRTLGLFVLAAWLLPAFWFFTYPEEGQRSWLTTYFSPLNLNFLFGMLSFMAFKHWAPIIGKFSLPVGLALFVAIFILEGSGQPYAVTQIPFGIAFALIILGLSSWEREGYGVSSGGLLSQLGNASYSIYLIHLPVLGVLVKIVRKLAEFFPVNAEILYISVYVATILAGYLAYVLVERRVLTLLRRERPQRYTGQFPQSSKLSPR